MAYLRDRNKSREAGGEWTRLGEWVEMWPTMWAGARLHWVSRDTIRGSDFTHFTVGSLWRVLSRGLT